jgi:glycosyltransferase involved in cell wall biosynthesis
VQAQLLWRLTEEARLRPVALLYPEAGAGATTGRYRLELQRGGERWLLRLRTGEPATRPRPDRAAAPERPAGQTTEQAATRLVDPALERAVTWAAGLCGAIALHVEGLGGMPLASLLGLQRGGMRLVLALHDFAAFCPRPHLMECREPPEPPRFCQYSREPERCARCLGRDVPGLPAGYQEERRTLAQALLGSAAAVVHPSEFLARAHGRLFGGTPLPESSVLASTRWPGIASSHDTAGRSRKPASRREDPAGAGAQRRGTASPPGVWVIAPAAPPSLCAQATGRARTPAPGPPRHFAWVGAVQAHKGALVLTAALERLAAAGHTLRITAYGGGDRQILARWRCLPGLRVRGYYRAGSLPALLRRDRIDCALLLSVVPESYGLTLDECAAAGVPVIAFDLGALGERITAGSGLLLGDAGAADPAIGSAALAALLKDLQDGRLAPPPPPAVPGPERHPAATARSWCALYRGLGLLPPDG